MIWSVRECLNLKIKVRTIVKLNDALHIQIHQEPLKRSQDSTINIELLPTANLDSANMGSDPSSYEALPSATV
jgi:hypothetical protein